METYLEIILFLAGFLIITVAASRLSLYFVKVKLPIITGLLVIGIIAGPFVLKLISNEALPKLGFINDISLSFIAFAAGAELYMSELRSKMKSIKWITFGQLFFTFTLSSTAIYFVSDYIPFMSELGAPVKLAISLLIGTIFVARSPVSAIAIINEMRAKGPFTKTVIGVVVVKEFLVIILFTICSSIANVLINNVEFDIKLLFVLIGELSLSFFLGYALGKGINLLLSFRMSTTVKSILLIGLGYLVFVLAHQVHFFSQKYLSFDIYIEPLLICILGGFYVVNYSGFKREFSKIVEKVTPMIYIMFFTLTGASLSLDTFAHTFLIALFFFFLRLIVLAIGTFFGGIFANDPSHTRKSSWMPYVTQAGISLGLVSIVSQKYPEWGVEFGTILVTVVVLNLFVGPPLFKWGILKVGESHRKHDVLHEKRDKKVFIFGLEGESLALARQLKSSDVQVSMVTRDKEKASHEYMGVQVVHIKDLGVDEMKRIGANEADSFVLFYQDKESLEICELAYEQFGTRHLVVRLHDRTFMKRFQDLGALIVEPASMLIGLMDHLVRSPIATSIILGMDESQDTVDVEMQNSDYHGMSIRELQMPSDIIILATKRNENPIISTGYTRLRIGDVLTLVGSRESLEKVKLKLGQQSEADFRQLRGIHMKLLKKVKSPKGGDFI
ncbi:potassium transporter TrkA [Ancylomarina euxinus]|uniref:Potassium transporter TrkA n=1 Tax=Ancylomarina euxinus TaxID=2283627 RepID=A0A425Y468_9BACT|nr:cation:proton antiporter [Ancylomarina euxinus]MCZ4694663.1 cation:proton antiporter [Ancylomarina euxinus]MUP14208.1 potassium transporter TrkA [Ancylomarina euxinus]RRG23059.1 potassium transporter TrkA [Ancylomarina euxinus]